MIRIAWVGAAASLVGVVGAAAIVIASSGGEEEIVAEIETPTPTPSNIVEPPASGASTTPAPTPVFSMPPRAPDCPPRDVPAGMELWQWGDVSTLVMEGGDVLSIGEFTDYDNHPVVAVYRSGLDNDRTLVYPWTGEIEHDADHGNNEPLIDEVLATIAVCPFDPSTAPWPYTSDPPNEPPQTWGLMRYFSPDPASGIRIGIGASDCPSGCWPNQFLVVETARSRMGVAANTALEIETSNIDIHPTDQEAFERFLASVQVVNP